MVWIDFVAGLCGGCAGVVLGHPFDTVKVRLQNGQARTLIGALVHNNNPLSLYAGIGSPLLCLTAINAIVFGIQAKLTESGAKTPFAGAMTGFAQTLITCPMELVKTQCQLNNSRLKPTFKLILRNRQLFRGFILTAMRDCPAFATYFTTYEYLNAKYNQPKHSDDSVSPLKMLVFGGLAGSLSWLIVYPVDVFKTRYQSDLSNERTIRDCIDVCVRERLLFRGLFVTLLRAFPVNAVTFICVEYVLSFYEQCNTNRQQRIE